MPNEGMKILVVDDDPAVLEVLPEMLTACGVSGQAIVSADGHKEGVSAFEGFSFDVAVLDCGEFKSAPDQFVDAIRRSVRMVVLIISGRPYGDYSDSLRSIANLSPDVLSFFLMKPFALKYFKTLLDFAARFLQEGHGISNIDLLRAGVSDRMCLMGGGRNFVATSELFNRLNVDNFFEILSTEVEVNVISVEFEAEGDCDKWFDLLRSVFINEYTSVFSNDSVDEVALAIFLGRLLDPRIGAFLTEIISSREGGRDVFPAFVHDVNNARGGDSEHLVEFAREQLVVLNEGFEKSQFVEEVSVKDVVPEYAGDAKVRLPTGALQSILRNFRGNFDKVSGGTGVYNCAVSEEDGVVVMRISDDAQVFPPDALTPLFQRVLSIREKGHAGSGRALFNISNMLSHFGGSICLRQAGVVKDANGLRGDTYELPEGATKEFEIRLPIAKN